MVAMAARRTFAALALAALALAACPPGTTEPIDSIAPEVDWSSPAELPPLERQDYRSEFVSDEEGRRFWPRSASVEPGIAYRFDTGHCGLAYLADFDGSFWRPIDPNGEARVPDFFINQDVGAIALVDFDTTVYRSSGGAEVTLVRVGGPVTTYDCA
jgi:hypothetical protein